MKRIYFLVPEIEMTRKIIAELRNEGMQEHHMHILARRGTPLEDIPEAGHTIKTDFIPAIERGVALGGATGLLAGVIGLRFAGFTIAGGTILGLIMAGATVGPLMAGLSGLAAGNSRLKQFEAAIENGEFLVLLDVPKEKIEPIRKAVIKHHPEAVFEGIEPILPPNY